MKKLLLGLALTPTIIADERNAPSPFAEFNKLAHHSPFTINIDDAYAMELQALAADIQSNKGVVMALAHILLQECYNEHAHLKNDFYHGRYAPLVTKEYTNAMSACMAKKLRDIQQTSKNSRE